MGTLAPGGTFIPARRVKLEQAADQDRGFFVAQEPGQGATGLSMLIGGKRVFKHLGFKVDAVKTYDATDFGGAASSASPWRLLPRRRPRSTRRRCPPQNRRPARSRRRPPAAGQRRRLTPRPCSARQPLPPKGRRGFVFGPKKPSARQRSGRHLDGPPERRVLLILRRRQQEVGGDHFTPHDLRRTFVSTLLDRGVDVFTVQKLAGHAEPATTARYDRRGEATKRKAAQSLSLPLSA